MFPSSEYVQAIIISLVTASLFGTIHPTQEEGRKVISLSAFASMVSEGGKQRLTAGAAAGTADVLASDCRAAGCLHGEAARPVRCVFVHVCRAHAVHAVLVLTGPALCCAPCRRWP